MTQYSDKKVQDYWTKTIPQIEEEIKRRRRLVSKHNATLSETPDDDTAIKAKVRNLDFINHLKSILEVKKSDIENITLTDLMNEIKSIKERLDALEIDS